MFGLANTRIALLAAAALLSLAASGGALGQGSLFDKAKETLGDYSGSLLGSEALGGDQIAAGLREALKVGSERVVR
ncbi:MAG: hypothetical protein OEU25_16250, partial [Rhodospirillales bacterium]|nr:hypothetical protein [Rhodospirillales bacterium]